MQRTLELAILGKGLVSPNPMVGCVIVHNERIIGEGWHKVYGGPHAEVNAVNAVSDKSLLHEATVYVNLEPCSHHGKTPPCADMLVGYKVKKVVIANEDSNPLVSGQGIMKLRDAGVDVVSGSLADEGRELNKRFFTFIEKKRPFIILKWAESSDGFIARENFDSKWISNEYSRQLVHRWRSEEDGIIVGSGTAKYDNPVLNVRDWVGKQPVRVVLDRNITLDSSLNLFDGKQTTLCYNLLKDEKSPNLEFVKMNNDNFLDGVVTDLYRRKIQSIIVEGGAKILTAFIQANLWDEARIFQSPKVFGQGIEGPKLNGRTTLKTAIDDDLLTIVEKH